VGRFGGLGRTFDVCLLLLQTISMGYNMARLQEATGAPPDSVCMAVHAQPCTRCCSNIVCVVEGSLLCAVEARVVCCISIVGMECGVVRWYPC
jgi:hypothetical protein